MPKKKPHKTRVYLIEKCFTCLTEGQIGVVQMLWLDKRWTQAALADKFKVSTSTIGIACRAIPTRFLTAKPSALKMRKARKLRLVKAG